MHDYSECCYITTHCAFTFFQVVINPAYNVFGYNYEPVTHETNKTGSSLLALSDVMRYSDAFRILTHCYGDKTDRHRLENNFGPKYPDVIAKYFSNVDELPNYIAKQLGFTK